MPLPDPSAIEPCFEPNPSPVIESPFFHAKIATSATSEEPFKYPPSFPTANSAHLSTAPAGYMCEESPKDEDPAWKMNEEDRRRYSKMFAKLPKSEDGFVLGKHARKLFKPFGIQDRRTLYKIWRLADRRRNGKLDGTAYQIAMHIATCVAKGLAVPNELPVSLQPGVLRLELEENPEERWEREQLQYAIAEYIIKHPGAAKALIDALGDHQRRLFEAWTFSLAQLVEINVESQEYNNIIDVKEDILQWEGQHMAAFQRERKRFDMETDYVSRQIRDAEDDIRQAEEDIARMEHQVAARSRSIAQSAACYKMHKAEVNALRSDFSNLDKLTEGQRFIVQQREAHLAVM